MRSFYTDHLGFTADLCKHLYRESTRLTVRAPEGNTIHLQWYDTWNDALDALRFMLPGATNDLTHEAI